jgi:hypothetical protein
MLSGCTHPTVQEIICLVAAAALAAALTMRARHAGLARLLRVSAAISAAALWTGTSAYSPLGFAEAGVPLLGGFRVSRPGRPAVVVHAGEVLLVNAGAVDEIEPITWPGAMIGCMWQHGRGSIDEPANCDVSYLPAAGADYDVIRVLVHSNCGAPATTGELRVSVLP